MKTEKEKLYEDIDFFRALYGVPFDKPIECVSMFVYYGSFDLEYHKFKAPGVCGVAMVGKKVDTVILNSNRTPEEQNFDCGHEFTHLIKHRKIQDYFKCFTSTKPWQNRFLEWQANEGSAQFIVPYQDFIPRFVDLLEQNTTWIPGTLAEHYHVTVPVINYRIDNLSYEIDQYRAGKSINQLRLLSHNQLKREGITPTCYNALCDFALNWDSEISRY